VGAPVGNQNGAKQKRLLTDTLKRELTQRPEDVLAIANKLIEAAKAGEPWAQSLIHDRVDGKAPQPIVGGDDEDGGPVRLSLSVAYADPATTET
jgi:hypothetical protein